MRANYNIWDKVWNIHLKNSNTITSKYLACSGNSTIIINYTTLIFDNYFKESTDNFFNERRDKDLLNDFHYIIARHTNNMEMFDFILRSLMWIPR